MTSPAGLGILVGIDGSPESHAAVRWAADEAVLRHRPVTLMHVVSPIIASWSIEAVLSDYQVWQEDHADNVIARTLDTLRTAVPGSPPDVRVERRHGGPVAELTAASADADLIVLGSRGLGPVGAAVLGSVSRALLHHAGCPVVLVREGVVRSTDRGLPVVLGIDGSPASEAATAFAFDEASRRGVDLVALHAWSDVAVFPFLGMDWHQFEEQGHEVLAERLAGWQERYPDVTIRRRVVCDKPARWLIDESNQSQLVVVGSRGRGGISGMLLGSVSTSVAESARAPVAVIRA
ncbi:universal stress protein [Mycolicibacterium diernhoferi]|uniref:Universal stress protein n=1 Tax=Mycolicibacterium diernhoferi TaxID=1801 RepID=A0A1Q4HEN3_9MYCO|nr:universal stress protein [Mycolicibacterium diernhoferi]OJZ66004.1 universal stress protein [Mycolicibacterium diernhoferi]OPE55028.1 universal stress protein [Mycolicibacterium diernhoferi]PEG54633.1 universal stress protein [Mycolicibacterium diernhoferi]QYL23910.1 universal stress protein [Mycolicibacterium diernhoferi]